MAVGWSLMGGRIEGVVAEGLANVEGFALELEVVLDQHAVEDHGVVPAHHPSLTTNGTDINPPQIRVISSVLGMK